MKKVFLLIAITFFTLQSYAQRHEIGLGIGNITYNTLYSDFTHTPWEVNILFIKSDNRRPPYWSLADLETEKLALPSLHYSYRLTKKTKLRLGYMHTQIKGIEDTVSVSFSGDIFVLQSYKIKTNEIFLGISYDFISARYFKLYLGLDAGYKDKRLTEKNTIINPNEDSEVVHNKTTYRSCNTNHLLGLSYCINKKFSIGYEMSLYLNLMNLELNLRPLNRLSINYQF